MNSRQRDKRQSWVLVVLVALAVGSFVFTAVADHNRAAEQQSQLQCVTDYTTANYARQLFLQKYASPRNDAQVSYEIAKAKAEPRSRVERLRVKFIAAARAYNAAVKANPLPAPPQLACGLRPSVQKPSVAPLHRPSSRNPGPGTAPTRSAPPPTPKGPSRGQRPSPHTKTATVTRPSTRPSPSASPPRSGTKPPVAPNPLRTLLCSVLHPLLPCRTEKP